MSDHEIILIPEDPEFAPTDERVGAAYRLLQGLTPEADNLEVILDASVRFFDCGANLEQIACPYCQTEIQLDWWHDYMDLDYVENAWVRRSYELPCCQQQATLNDLIYRWPMGFSRFALVARNPGIGRIKDADLRALQELLGTRLKAIYRHI